MPTLADLQAAAADAQSRYELARDRLANAQQAAQDAIATHAEIQCRFVSGAGTQDDVDAAAAARDDALANLQAILDKLAPGPSVTGTAAA